jgi:hypothetical protein
MVQLAMRDFDLPIGQLQIDLRAIEPIRLPAFAGSKLEGAFGRTLYEISCTRRDLESCQPCPLRQICPYGTLYAPTLPADLKVDSLKQPPRPLIFVAEMARERVVQPHESFGFGLVVVGRALQHLPYIVAAIRQMGERGIGLGRGRFELIQVSSQNPYTGQSQSLASAASPVVAHQALQINQADLPALPESQLTLHLETFTHIKSGGKVVEALQFPVLVRALQRRVSNLEQIYGGARSQGANYSQLPLLARGVELIEQQTRHSHQARSGKGRDPIIMNGLVGRVTYRGDLQPFAILLRFGELVGVGRWAHFGAGRYRIVTSGAEDGDV